MGLGGFVPYITKDARLFVDGGTIPLTAGKLNYKITQVCRAHLQLFGTNYDTINEIIGVLECAKQEFYRRIAVPYEDEKIKQNGDVY